MAPSALAIDHQLRKYGVKVQLEPGCSDPANAAYKGQGVWDPRYVLLHHTAGPGGPGLAPSLGWVMHNSFEPVRACNFLVARDGTVHLVYAYGAYHAGLGGPGKWGNGPVIAKDTMNRYAFGIEIESKGTSLRGKKKGNGYTKAQVEATARLTAALLDLIGSNVPCAINHRTWAPGRKSDTLRSDKWWHRRIRRYKRFDVKFRKRSHGWGEPGKRSTRQKAVRQPHELMGVVERRKVLGVWWVKGTDDLWYRAKRTNWKKAL